MRTRFFRAAAALCVVAAGAAYGWNVPVKEAHLIGSTVRTAPVGLGAGDFDGDGAPDLLIETTQTNLVWLKNINAAVSNWVGLVISSGSNDVPLAVADFDHDGDPDVLTFVDQIVGEAFQWYENSASGTTWTAHVLDDNLPAGAAIRAVALGDFDRDGSMDFVVGFQNANIPLYWYANTGAGLWARHEAAGATNGLLAVADVDRDGDPDIVRLSGGKAQWLVNEPGATSNWTVRAIATNSFSASTHAMLDVDQDGDADLVTLGFTGGWFENSGLASNWVFHAAGAFRSADVALPFDLDGDGDEDVVADDAWYDNPGRNPGSWLRRPFTNVAPALLHVAGLGDVDRDGDADVITVSVSNKLHWVEIARPALSVNFGSARTVATNVTQASDIEPADLDRDGDLDLVVSSFGGGLSWFQSAGPGASWTQRVIATNLFDFSAVATGDLDSDGDLDVAASFDSGGQLMWYRNLDGLGGSWQASTVATSVVSIRDLKAATINNDPFPDLAATVAFSDDVLEWRNLGGSGTNWVQRTVTNDIPNPYGLDLGDLDRDGDPDIVATESSGTRLRWFRNPINNAGTNWLPRVITTNAPGYAGVALADLDGDGDLDVAAVSTQTDSLDLWINTSGDGLTWMNYSVVALFSNPYGVIARDFNRDGLMDLATTEAGDNRASIFYNLGSFTVWLRRNLATSFTGTLALAAADIDDNGTTDLAVGSTPGSSIVWFPKESYADLQLTKTVKTSPVNYDAPVSFTLVLTNHGPETATSVVVTDALPAEIIWTNDTAGAGPPAGSNLIWNIGTLAVGQAVTCVVQGITAPGSGDRIAVTNRARVYFDGDLAVASNGQAEAAVILDDLLGTVVTNFDGASDAAFADFDGDGWTDVVACASNANTVAIYRNGGFGTNWTLAGIATTFTNPTRLVVADFNRDGDMDTAAISPRTGRLTWWDGPALSAPVVVATGQTGSVSIEAADFDGDGDMDLLSCITGSTSVVWFRNGGGPATNWTRQVISAAAGNAADAAAADLDRDGDADVVAINSGGVIGRYMNLDGAGTSWSASLLGSGSSGGSAITTADFDGDGDADVAAAWAQTGQIGFWENVGGAGSSWTQRVDFLFHAGVSGIAASDWDGDGDMDIVTSGSAAGTILWWENLDRRGHNWGQHALLASAAGAHSIALGDVDHDGAPDFVTARSTGDRVHWGSGDAHPWPGVIAEAHRRVLTNGWYEAGALALFDADRDGDLDMASYSRSNKTIRLWHNLDRAGTRWSFTNVTSTLGYLGGLDHGDLDGDGDQDLVSYPDLANEGIWLWENSDGTGTTWLSRQVCGSSVLFEVTDSVLCDLDRDGDLDIAVAAHQGAVYNVFWFGNGEAAGGAWSTNLITASCTNATTLDARDLDGDGDPDLAVGGDEMYVLANNGTATGWTQFTMSVSATYVGDLTVCDLDRNGTNDILYASGANVRFIRFAISYTNATDTFLGFGQGTTSDILPADFDSDGDLDIVILSESYIAGTGKVVVLENITTNSTLTFARSADAALDTVGGSELQLGDIDGDGDPDIAASFHATTSYGAPPDLAWWPNRAINAIGIRKQVTPVLLTNQVTLSWVITVSNGLPATAGDVVVTDWLPPAATWISDTCGVGAPGTNAWTWNIGTLAAGAVVSCTITASVSPAVLDEIVNHARVTSDGASPELATATASLSTNDFDGDGLPNVIDTDDDNDALPDSWELLYGLNLYNAADAANDNDADGFTNLQEFIALTHPGHASDFFRVTGIITPAGVTIAYSPSDASRRYSLEYSLSPTNPWLGAPGQSNIIGGSGILTNTAASTNRLYRVRVGMP